MTKKILITGAKGFIGRNLASHLNRIKDLEFFLYDLENTEDDLRLWLNQADVIFHLAGVNRPKQTEEFETGNHGFTDHVCEILGQLGRKPKMVMSSSIQAELDNPYGMSKRRAEESVQSFSKETGTPISIYRLKNVYGKWCRPDYNSVTATFCHNIANDLPISISDPNHEIELIYIDDIIDAFVSELSDRSTVRPSDCRTVGPSTKITLGDLAGRIQAFHEMKTDLLTPDFSERFNQCLYATYLSYVPSERREYGLDIKSDDRGSLAEFIKSRHSGQIFVSRTHPGITRGNHYHHTKTEKFFVIEGEGLIRMRHIEGEEIVEYRVKGEEYRVIDIPPGYTHSITNIGQEEMITLFWASEVLNPDHPDTYYLDVD